MIMIGAPGGYSAATTFAQLLWANGASQPPDSLVPGGQTTTFRSGNTVGRISLITDTIIGLTPDSAAATFAMVAWDNSSGQYPTWTQASAAWDAGKIAAGESTAFTVNDIGGSVNMPPVMLPPSFDIFPWPEPSTGALTLLGLGCLLLCRRRKLIVAAFALTVAGGVFAQGTVAFSSYNSLGTVHYWVASPTAPWQSLSGNSAADSPAGTTDYEHYGMMLIGSTGTGGHWGSSTTFAQLLWANGASQPLNSLVPGGQTTTFRTGNTVGRFTAITDTITGLTPDSDAATFALVIWDNSSGQYPTWTQASVAWLFGKIGAGESSAFTVNNIGGTANVPPICMAPSFNIWPSPEPSYRGAGVAGPGVLGLVPPPKAGPRSIRTDGGRQCFRPRHGHFWLLQLPGYDRTFGRHPRTIADCR